MSKRTSRRKLGRKSAGKKKRFTGGGHDLYKDTILRGTFKNNDYLPETQKLGLGSGTYKIYEDKQDKSMCYAFDEATGTTKRIKCSDVKDNYAIFKVDHETKRKAIEDFQRMRSRSLLNNIPKPKTPEKPRNIRFASPLKLASPYKQSATFAPPTMMYMSKKEKKDMFNRIMSFPDDDPDDRPFMRK